MHQIWSKLDGGFNIFMFIVFKEIKDKVENLGRQLKNRKVIRRLKQLKF